MSRPHFRALPVWQWVVIGAVLLLAAGLALPRIVWPPVAPGVGLGERCRANLRSLVLGLALYAQDYGDQLPPASRWADAVRPYGPDEVRFECPALPGKPGYAFNLDLASHEEPSETASRPVAPPLLFDSSAGRPNAADALTSFAARHGSGGYVAFLDGHISWGRTPPEP